MPDLTEFLLARISEDEDRAGDFHALDCNTTEQAFSEGIPGATYSLQCTCGHTPRVLAECEAKRRIIAKHQRVKFTDVSLGIVDADVCQKCHHVEESPDDVHDDDWTYPLIQDDFPCKTLRYLAAVYADHPDFDPSWRVE